MYPDPKQNEPEQWNHKPQQNYQDNPLSDTNTEHTREQNNPQNEGPSRQDQYHPPENNTGHANDHQANWQGPQYPQPQQYDNSNQSAPNVQTQPINSSQPGIIILQWLTYAFWGWTLIALSVLISSVIYNFIDKNNGGDTVMYAMAATLVLLPISAVCDYFYSKNEPAKKQGSASLVMIIHAVIFALFGIGAIIVAVFSTVRILTSSSESTASQVALYSSVIVAVLYAAVFLRTLSINKLPWVKRYFTIFMIAVIGIISILGIIGPIANTRKTRDDRLITDNINTITESIGYYADSSNKLPDNLAELSLKGDSKKLVDKGLIIYTPNTNTSMGASSLNNSLNNLGVNSYGKETTFYYTLCANFVQASSNSNSYSAVQSKDSSYSEYISAYDHGAGKECYKIKKTTYEQQ